MTASNHGNVPEKNFNAKEERKLRKPLIEKRRRERINCSLEQLKGIMVDAYNLDQSKLEKADVLEITVQHMEGLQRSQGQGGQGSSMGFESRQRYSSGYIQCMHEVHNLLLSCPGMDKTLGARLLNHLLKSLPHISVENAGMGGSSNVGPAGTGRGIGGGASSLLPASPTHTPHSLPSFQPHALEVHTPPPPPSPPSPDSPHHSPSIPTAREVGGVRAREQPSPRSLPSLPRPPTNHGHPSLPHLQPGGDPSMWRPW
ncbi:hairy-related 8a [Chanos chanos]|uniref:Hairy-related 8a n=1 Tax=Chanos chanos TaxID=29144 RepID=A0A6J2VSM0_CHACN|nr:transcription cofactor HES-6-like [Chanos chanos]